MAIQELQRGVMNNPFQVIGGTEKIGPDAIVVENTAAGAGVVAQVIGPNKIIMDTGYFAPNTFLGPLMCDVIFYSNVGFTDVITLELWRRNPAGYEEIVYTRSRTFYGDISPYFGNNILNVNCTVNNEYRMVFKSHSANAATTTVGIDYIKINPKNQFTVNSSVVYSGVAGNYGSPTEITIWRATTVCASAGSSGFTNTFTTGFDCTGTDVSIQVTPGNFAVGGTMPFMIVSAVSSTGFSVYFQNAAGTAMTGNMTLYCTVTRTIETTKV